MRCRFLDPFSSWCKPTGKYLYTEDQTVSTATVISTVVCAGQALGFQANKVDGYVPWSASLHDIVGVRRFWDQKSSSGLISGRLNLAIAVWMTLTFMTVHPFQFSFADAEEFFQGI